jgi:hypothetical protein
MSSSRYRSVRTLLYPAASVLVFGSTGMAQAMIGASGNLTTGTVTVTTCNNDGEAYNDGSIEVKDGNGNTLMVIKDVIPGSTVSFDLTIPGAEIRLHATWLGPGVPTQTDSRSVKRS